MNQKFYSNFITFNGDIFIKEFKDFYQNNANYEKDLKNLLQNLNKSCQNNIINFLNLVNNLPLPTKDFLINKNKLFNKEQLKVLAVENKFNETIANYYNKYNLTKNEKLTINVFKYHMGLKFLSKETLKQIFNNIAIDIGAFWGDSALITAKYKPSKIFAFEPNTVNFNNLQNTVSNNLIYPINPINIALGDKEGVEEINFVSNNQNHGASILYKAQKHKTEKINITTLDAFTKQNNYLANNKIGFIKIDTEGYGFFVIKGSLETIKKHKPIISVAIYHNPQELFYIKPLLEQINPNYKFMVLELDQTDTLKDLTLLAF